MSSVSTVAGGVGMDFILSILVIVGDRCEKYSWGSVMRERVEIGRGNFRKSITERFLSGRISARISGGMMGSGELVKKFGASESSMPLPSKYFKV